MANLPGYKKTMVVPCEHMGIIRKLFTFYDDPEQVVETIKALGANRTGKSDGYYGDSSTKPENVSKFGQDLLAAMPYAVKQKYDWLKTGDEGKSWYGGSSSSDETGCPEYEMNAGFWSFIPYVTGDSVSSISQTYPLAIVISNHVTTASTAMADNIEKLVVSEKNKNGVRMPDDEARDYITSRYTACLQKNSTENLAWKDLVEDCTENLKDTKRSEFRKKLNECVKTEADKKDCSSDLPTFDREDVAQTCIKETRLLRSDVELLFDQRYYNCIDSIRKIGDPTTFAVSISVYDVLSGTSTPKNPANTTDVCQSALAMVTKPTAKKAEDEEMSARSKYYSPSSPDEEKVLAPKDKLNKIFQAYGVHPGKFEWEDWRKYHDFSVPASDWDKTLLIVGGRLSKWFIPGAIILRFIFKGGIASVAIKAFELAANPTEFVAKWKAKWLKKHPPKTPKAPKGKGGGDDAGTPVGGGDPAKGTAEKPAPAKADATGPAERRGFDAGGETNCFGPPGSCGNEFAFGPNSIMAGGFVLAGAHALIMETTAVVAGVLESAEAAAGLLPVLVK